MPALKVALKAIRAKFNRYLAAPAAKLLAVAGTPYFLDAPLSNGTDMKFDEPVAGRYRYTGDQKVVERFIGTANVEADKVSTVTFVLYKNGSPVAGASTPVGFPSANLDLQFAINREVELVNGDYLEVWASSDTANTTITVETIQISYDGYEEVL